MKKSAFCLSLVLMLCCNASFAQLSVIMGKVLDENGKPVAGAELKISGNKKYYKVKTDKDGIYNTQAILTRAYRVIIDANGKYYSVERVKMVGPDVEPTFYNFILAGDHVEIRTDMGKDPAMVAQLEKLEADINKD